MKYQLKIKSKKLDNSITNPISVFHKIRKKYANSVLFEVNDTKKNEHFSYICFDVIAFIKVTQNTLYQRFPNESTQEIQLNLSNNLVNHINDFCSRFTIEKHSHNFINNGLFGYLSYDAVRYFEGIHLKKNKNLEIPDVFYNLYQNMIVIDHLKNETYILKYTNDCAVNFSYIENIITHSTIDNKPFQRSGDIQSNMDNEHFKTMVAQAKKHCLRGDVFQLVLSRRFSQKFEGDELKVYKALREINPSPYLFFFDYSEFKIFGSSPEAQLIVKNDSAEIHPIAGTYKRTGDKEKDNQLANSLINDAKENAEHVMLVDLARNDLSKNGNNVKVETFKEVQFFSHVIHLVSKVIGKKNKAMNTMQLVADTFPAGTLSGAPKFKAMQLIEKYEPINRDFYGGAIGHIDFDGNFNHAIMIRTFLSKSNTLHWQAGAGIVIHSSEENELKEVFNKSKALTTAIDYACES